MKTKRRVFLYPITKELVREGSNTYIRNVIKHLGEEFVIVNHITAIGLLDAIKKFRRTDIYYFNWVEDLPTKKWGLVQTILLPFLLLGCKLTGKKVVWFIHNNISHNREYLRIKKLIIRLMSVFSDIIFTHSNELKIWVPKKKLHVFHHPVDTYTPVINNGTTKYDLLIWGTVSPYKGISEFVDYAVSSKQLQKSRIIIAGKFHSQDYYEHIKAKISPNISLVDKTLTEEELTGLFAQSRYILFTYASPSVLSSAALCKTLSFGKEIIGPSIGSFKELGQQGLLYNFDSMASLEKLLQDLENGQRKGIVGKHTEEYVGRTSWANFSRFLYTKINLLFT